MSYLKNTSGQYLYFTMVSAADGSAITTGTVSGFRSIDGGSQASVTGTISHKGNGQWELALSQADTNGDEIGFLFTHASGIPVSLTIVTDTKKVGTLNDIAAADVWSSGTRTLTAFGFSVTVGTNNDKSGYSLSAAGVDDVLDETVEGSLTLRQLLRIFLSALGGKSGGGGTNTVTFRDNGDTKDRITATVDANGNRTAVTLDGS